VDGERRTRDGYAEAIDRKLPSDCANRVVVEGIFRRHRGKSRPTRRISATRSAKCFTLRRQCVVLPTHLGRAPMTNLSHHGQPFLAASKLDRDRPQAWYGGTKVVQGARKSPRSPTQSPLNWRKVTDRRGELRRGRWRIHRAGLRQVRTRSHECSTRRRLGRASFRSSVAHAASSPVSGAPKLKPSGRIVCSLGLRRARVRAWCASTLV
jgi:hypothetical protein